MTYRSGENVNIPVASGSGNTYVMKPFTVVSHFENPHYAWECHCDAYVVEDEDGELRIAIEDGGIKLASKEDLMSIKSKLQCWMDSFNDAIMMTGECL